MRPRTKRQREILNYIRDCIENHGFEPSYQQIANHIGVKSKSGVAKHIESLEKKGLLARQYINGSFHLELTPQETVSELLCEIEWLKNPLTIRNPFQRNILLIPKFLLGYRSSTTMRAMLVEDNAMLNEHICEDDVALIESKTFARDGEIVAVLISKKMLVLRKFYRHGADIKLHAANDNFDTIIKAADKIKILGIFRGLLRPFI